MSHKIVQLGYDTIWSAALPFIRWYIKRKDLSRGISNELTNERFGYSVLPGIIGKSNQLKKKYWTLWIHGASIGECLSALPIVNIALSKSFKQQLVLKQNFDCHHEDMNIRVLISTTTASARQLLPKRLPPHTSCIFAPIDHPDCVERFYAMWTPNAAIFIESELWPNLIQQAAQHNVPLAILNGRISTKSYHRWKNPFIKGFRNTLLSKFSLVGCQGVENQRRLRNMGAFNPILMPSLKFATRRVSEYETHRKKILHELQASISGRPTWLAVSTHEGEEDFIVETHIRLTTIKNLDKALLIIVPRHPSRAARIIQNLQKKYPFLSIALQSRKAFPSASTDVYIVDSFGEIELFCELIDVVIIGGSFTHSVGGHNPIEPLRAGCQIIVGPYMTSFESTLAQLQSDPILKKCISSISVVNSTSLLDSVYTLLTKTSDNYPSFDSETFQHKSTQRHDRIQAMELITHKTFRLYEQKIMMWLT